MLEQHKVTCVLFNLALVGTDSSVEVVPEQVHFAAAAKTASGKHKKGRGEKWRGKKN